MEQDVISRIDGVQLKKLLRAKKFEKVFSLTMFWVYLIIYSLLSAAFLVYSILWMPECWFKTFISEHVYISIFLYFVITIVVFFVLFFAVNKSGSLKDEFKQYMLDTSDLSAEDIIEIGKIYGIEDALNIAVQKRLKELNITKVPRSCTDGREILRLPTEEDLI